MCVCFKITRESVKVKGLINSVKYTMTWGERDSLGSRSPGAESHILSLSLSILHLAVQPQPPPPQEPGPGPRRRMTSASSVATSPHGLGPASPQSGWLFDGVFECVCVFRVFCLQFLRGQRLPVPRQLAQSSVWLCDKYLINSWNISVALRAIIALARMHTGVCYGAQKKNLPQSFPVSQRKD